MKLLAVARWLAGPLLLAFPLPAQITNVSVAGVTNTQAMIRYTAPDPSACTVAVSQSPTYSPLVHDVDPAIFPASNLDNRPGSVSDGQPRAFVAGTRDAEQGINGHWYSRALQALTPHYFQITCGPYTATGSFTTANIALGNIYNDVLPAAPSAPGNGYSYAGQYAWPEFLQWDATNPASRQESVIDPQTGLLIKRATMPQDFSSSQDVHNFSSAVAPTGVWSNPSNALATNTAVASYTGTTQDWLLLTDSNPNLDVDNGKALESLLFSVKGWCVGTCTGDRAKIQVCLTFNGVSCWPGASNVYEIALGTTAQPTAFSNYGSTAENASMLPWTPPGFPVPISWEAKRRTASVNVDVSGNVSFVVGSGSQFNPWWTAGSLIAIGSSACTITGLANPRALTIVPAACSPALAVPVSNASYSAGNFGLMIRKKTTDTDTINVHAAQYTLGRTAQGSWPSGGLPKVFSSTPTLNTITGHLGYRFVYGNTPQVYWLDTVTGDANWLGHLTGGSHANPDGWSHTSPTASVTFFSLTGVSTDPEHFYLPGNDNNGNGVAIIGCTLSSSNQPGDLTISGCANLTPASTNKDPLGLLAAFTAGQAVTFDRTYFTAWGIDQLQNGKLYLSARPYQNARGWVFIFDPNLVGNSPGCVGGGNPGCVIAAMPTWAAAPARWLALHSTGYSGEADISLWTGYQLDGSGGTTGQGPYSVAVSSSLTSTAGIAAGSGSCPAGSHGCDNIAIDGEPCNITPRGTDPLNCPKNGSWSYLQDAAVGDVISNLAGPFNAGQPEFFKVLAKTDATHWLIQRDIGNRGLTTPNTPINLWERGLLRSDGFQNGISTMTANWDFLHDPHGLNADGTGVRVYFEYDHMSASSRAQMGDLPYYLAPPSCGGSDPTSLNTSCLSYGVYDGIGYLNPTKFTQLHPLFAGVGGLTAFNEIAQDHPNRSQEDGSKWFMDARPVSGPGNETATPVTGSLYKMTTTTTDGDALRNIGAGDPNLTIDRKLVPTAAWCGTQPLIDVSSATTGDVITGVAADAYKYCIARKVGECRAASAQGDIYSNCPFTNTRAQNAPVGSYGCANVFAENGLGLDLCFANPGFPLNGLVQIGYQNASDASGSYQRVLTHGLMRYRLLNVNENTRTTPDGKWLLFEGQDFGNEYQILSAKMPPYPEADSAIRTAFLAMSVQLQPPNGRGIDNALVQFGYAENGAPDQFYCTSRHEACVAASATVPQVPFKFPSDSLDGTLTGLTGMPCASGCSLAIPSLSQRILYYQVLYRDSTNHVVAETRVQAVPTP